MESPLFNFAIFGTGGLAKEIGGHLTALAEKEGKCGYIVPDSEAWRVGNPFGMGVIIGTDSDHPEVTNYIIGVGEPTLRCKMVEKLKAKWSYCPNVWCKQTQYYGVMLKQGNFFAPGVLATVDIILGSFNFFNLNSTIGHDVQMGDCNVVNPGANISGGARIGSNCLIGTGAQILENVHIGNNVRIGAGAVVTKNVLSWSTVVGIPARPMEQKRSE